MNNTLFNEVQVGKSFKAYLIPYCKAKGIDPPSFTIGIHQREKKEGDGTSWTAMWQHGNEDRVQKHLCFNALDCQVNSMPANNDSTTVTMVLEQFTFVVVGVEKKLAKAILATMLHGFLILPNAEYDAIRASLNAEDIFMTLKPPTD